MDKIEKEDIVGKVRNSRYDARRDREYAQKVLSDASYALQVLPKGRNKEKLLKFLRLYLINNNCQVSITPESPITPAPKFLIRDDCNGNISGIDTNFMSPEYLEITRQDGENCKRKMYKVPEYEVALQDSVYGREMKGFKSYEAVEYQLLVNLINEGITPDVIRKMNITDFRDFVKEYCYDAFVKYREQEGFVKVFIRSNENSFGDLLIDNGVHPIYVEKLIENMKTKGCADSFELEFKGQVITGPGFDIDHKNPVYCPNNIMAYPDVNEPYSLAVVEKCTHRLKHQLEHRVALGDGMFGYEKIQWPKSCVAVLDFEHYLVYDFSNPDRKIMPRMPLANNLIHLNRIETFVQNLDLSKENKRSRGCGNRKNDGRQ